MVAPRGLSGFRTRKNASAFDNGTSKLLLGLKFYLEQVVTHGRHCCRHSGAADSTARAIT